MVYANEVHPYPLMAPPPREPQETPASLREEASKLLEAATKLDVECTEVIDDLTVYAELIEASQAEVTAAAEASHEAMATVTTANTAEDNCRQTLEELDEKIRLLQAERRQAVDQLEAATTERLRAAAEKSGLDLHLFERRAALAVNEQRKAEYQAKQVVTRSELRAKAAENRAQAWRLLDEAARMEVSTS